MRKMPDPSELKPLLEKPQPHEVLRRETESRVTRWEWVTGEPNSLRPWYHEIHGFSRGKRLTKPPHKKEGLVRIGLDPTGRPALIERYAGLKDRFAESFFVGDENETVEYYYPQSPNMKSKPLSVSRYRFVDGRLTDYALLADAGSVAEAYEYDGPRLASIRVVRRPPLRKAVYRLRYSPQGSLQAIEDGAHRVVHKRSLPKFAELLQEMRDALVQAIPEVIAKYKAPEPAFCLALAYDSESTAGVLPPTLTLGLESDLRDWKAPKRKRSLHSLWDPQQFRTFEPDELELDDNRLMELSADIAQHLATRGDTEPARKLLVDVCKELNKLDWSKRTQVTKRFVVYPIDLEGADLQRNLKAAVPARTLNALKAEGLL